MCKIDLFISRIKSYNSSDAFNPYSDLCPVYDNKDSASYRTDLLKKMLHKACQEPMEAIWLGRDLGHRGGRRTGLALTDDFNVENHLKRWGLECEYRQAESFVKEQTATVIWQSLNQISENIFLWNLFPYHPFNKNLTNSPFNNRCHNYDEYLFGVELLKDLVEIVHPKYILAIGNNAYFGAVENLDIEVKKVRHPSYGGQNEFTKQISQIYGI